MMKSTYKSLAFTNALLLSTLMVMPVVAGTINVGEERDAYDKIEKRAANLISERVSEVKEARQSISTLRSLSESIKVKVDEKKRLIQNDYDTNIVRIYEEYNNEIYPLQISLKLLDDKFIPPVRTAGNIEKALEKELAEVGGQRRQEKTVLENDFSKKLAEMNFNRNKRLREVSNGIYDFAQAPKYAFTVTGNLSYVLVEFDINKETYIKHILPLEQEIKRVEQKQTNDLVAVQKATEKSLEDVRKSHEKPLEEARIADQKSLQEARKVYEEQNSEAYQSLRAEIASLNERKTQKLDELEKKRSQEIERINNETYEVDSITGERISLAVLQEKLQAIQAPSDFLIQQLHESQLAVEMALVEGINLEVSTQSGLAGTAASGTVVSNNN